jgi:hypothetical protein
LKNCGKIEWLQRRKRFAAVEGGLLYRGPITPEASSGSSFIAVGALVIPRSPSNPLEKNLGRDRFGGTRESSGASLPGVLTRFHPVHMVIHIFKDIDPPGTELVKKEPFPFGGQKFFQHDVT